MSIPIEQQICLLKAPDNVKEKAMVKLKEVKAKSEDSGSKAKNYLDGLLKIPFNIYKREPLLFFMKKTNEELIKLLNELKNIDTDLKIPIKEKYSSIELKKHLTYLNEEYIDEIKVYTYEKELIELLKTGEFNLRFLGDDYKNKDNYTGKELGIPIHYLSRDHGWSATKFKEKIYEQIKNK